MENMVILLGQGLARRGMGVSLLVLGRQGPAADRARRCGHPGDDAPGGSSRTTHIGRSSRDQGVGLVNAHYSTYGAAIAAEMGIPFVQVVHNAYVWLDDRAIARYRQADAAHGRVYLRLGRGGALFRRRRWASRRRGWWSFPTAIDGGRLDEARGYPAGELRDELGLSEDDYVFLNVASIHATKAHKASGPAPSHAWRRAIRTPRLVIVGPASDPSL